MFCFVRSKCLYVRHTSMQELFLLHAVTNQLMSLARTSGGATTFWPPHGRKHVLMCDLQSSCRLKQLHLTPQAAGTLKFLVCFLGIQWRPTHPFHHTKPLSSANHGAPSSLHAVDKTGWTPRRFPNSSLQAPSRSHSVQNGNTTMKSGGVLICALAVLSTAEPVRSLFTCSEMLHSLSGGFIRLFVLLGLTERKKTGAFFFLFLLHFYLFVLDLLWAFRWETFFRGLYFNVRLCWAGMMSWWCRWGLSSWRHLRPILDFWRTHVLSVRWWFRGGELWNR